MEKLDSQQKQRLGTDFGSDCKLPIAKISHNLKKGGKTTRPFRYDLKKSLHLYSGSEK